MELHQLQATEDAITHEMEWKTRSIDAKLVDSSGKTVVVDLVSRIKPPPKNGRGPGLININHLMQQCYAVPDSEVETWTRQSMKHRKVE